MSTKVRINERNDFLWMLLVFVILILATTPPSILLSLTLSGLGYLLGKLGREVWYEEQVRRKGVRNARTRNN